MFGLKKKNHSPIWDHDIFWRSFKKKLYSLNKDWELEKLVPLPYPEDTSVKLKAFLVEYYKNAGNLLDFYKDLAADEQVDEMPPNIDTPLNFYEAKSVFFEGQIRQLAQGLIQGRTHKRAVYEYTWYGMRNKGDLLYNMPEQHYPFLWGSPELAEYDGFADNTMREPKESVYEPNDVIPELDEQVTIVLDDFFNYVSDISSTFISFSANSKIMWIILWLIGFVYGLYIFCYFFYYFYKFIVLGILGLIKWIWIRSDKMIENTEMILLKMAKNDRKGVRLSFFTNWDYLSKMMSIGTTLLKERKIEVEQEEKERIKKEEEEVKKNMKIYGLGESAKRKKTEPEERILIKKQIVKGKIVLTLVPRTNENILKDVLSPFYYHSIFLAGKNNIFNMSDELNLADYYNNWKRTKKIENVPEGLHLNWFYYDYYNYKNRNNYKWAFRYDFSTQIISNMSEISNQRMIPIQKNWNKDWERSRFNFFDLPSGVLKQEKEKTKWYSTFPLGEKRILKTPQLLVTMPAQKLIDIVYWYCILFMTGFCGNSWHAAAFYSFVWSLVINWKHLEIQLGKRRDKEVERAEVLKIKQKKETEEEKQEREVQEKVIISKKLEYVIDRSGSLKYYRKLYNYIIFYIEEKKIFFFEEVDLLKIKLKVLWLERIIRNWKENQKWKFHLESTKGNQWKEFFKIFIWDEANVPRTAIRINNFIKLLIFGTSFFVGWTYIIKSPSWLIFIREKVQRHEAFMQDKILNFW
jgi:hypothetical protein